MKSTAVHELIGDPDTDETQVDNPLIIICSRAYTRSDVCGLLALALYWTWIFLIFFTNISTDPVKGFAGSDFMLKACAMFGQVFFLIANLPLLRGSRLRKGRRTVWTFALTRSSISIVAALGYFRIDVPLAIAMLCWLLMGCGQVYLLVESSRLLHKLDSIARGVAVAVATLFAGLVFGLAISLPPPGGIIVAALVFLTSTALVTFAVNVQLPTPAQPSMAARAKKPPAPGFKAFIVCFAFYSYVFGVSLAFGVGLLPLPFVDQIAQTVCCALIIVGFT